MPEAIVHSQWRDEQAPSKYPFGDNASLVTTDGVSLGEDTFLDARVYPIGGGVRMSLQSITVESGRTTLYIGPDSAPRLCFTWFDPVDPPDLLRLEDVWGRSAGVLVSEALRLARFQSWQLGTHQFASEAAELAASVCIPTPEIGVRGMITEEGDILTGDAWIVGENGVVVREDPEGAEEGTQVIRVDLVGDPLFRRALCGDKVSGLVPLFSTPRFLQTINDIPPDAFGNYVIGTAGNIAPDNILRVVPTPEGLRFEAVGQKSGDI